MRKFTLLFLALLGAIGVKAQVEWTIWEGSFTKTHVYLSPADFTNIAVGDKILVYGTGALSKGLHKQTGGNWEWGDVTGYTATETGTNANYYYTVDAKLVTLLESNDLRGFVIGNSNEGTITKVSILKNTSMIKTVLSSTAVNFGNWANGYWSIDNSDALGKVVAGDFFYIPATRQTGKYTDNAEEKDINYWQAQIYDGTNQESSWKYSINSFNHDMWAQVQETDVTNIHNNKISANGQFYNCTGLYIYHPVSSFSIGSIGMATFCANVAVSVPAGISAFYATLNAEKTAVVLNKIDDGVIPANTGVIITGEEGSVVEFTATTTATTYSFNVLHGTTTATTITADDYVLYNNGGTAEFRRVTTSELAANKAYLPASALSAGARLSIVFDDSETAINTVEAQGRHALDDGYYTLSGQRVEQPTKGLYIKNGKKYIIK